MINNRKGLTLVHLLVVIVLLGIVTTFIAPGFMQGDIAIAWSAKHKEAKHHPSLSEIKVLYQKGYRKDQIAQMSLEEITDIIKKE